MATAATLITEAAADHAARETSPQWQTRHRLEQARQCAESLLQELDRALAGPDAAIVFHVQSHADNLTWPAGRALDFTRDAIAHADTVDPDEAARMMGAA